MNGYIQNIEKLAIENTNFRTVAYTAKHSQLTLMHLQPKEEIGMEVHDVDQFLRIEKGSGRAVLDGVTTSIADGSAVIVPAGVNHNIINDSDTEPMKLYTLYCPPHHRDGVVHVTKADAENDTEHFDGVTSEKE
ncbi:MAG: cupin domain-containing protein [Candidatus Andersenbacteria bacterium]